MKLVFDIVVLLNNFFLIKQLLNTSNLAELLVNNFAVNLSNKSNYRPSVFKILDKSSCSLPIF